MADAVLCDDLARSGSVTLDTLDAMRARLDRAASASKVDLSAVTRLHAAGPERC